MSRASIAISTRDVAVGSLRTPASAASSEIVLASDDVGVGEHASRRGSRAPR